MTDYQKGDIIKVTYADHAGYTNDRMSDIKISINWNIGEYVKTIDKPAPHILLKNGDYSDTDNDPLGDWTLIVLSCVSKVEVLKGKKK